MGKANLAKKKQWRHLPDSAPVETLQTEFQQKTAATLPADQLFVVDKKGDQATARRTYPDKFAKERVKTVGKKAGKQHTAQQRTEKKDGETGVFDLWGGEEAQGEKREQEGRLDHIPAVIPPLPGQSYNPRKPDLETAWSKVLTEETQKDHAASEHQRIVHGFTVVETDAVIPSDSEGEGETQFRKNPPTLNRKPTKAKVNKKMRWLMRLREGEREKEQKELNKAVDQIPKIIAETESRKPQIDAEYELTLKRQREEKELEASGMKAPKLCMGQYVYKLPETEAVYSQEPKSLRQMKAKASAVDTCFDSLVRRGKVDLCEAKRKPKIISKNRYTGELGRETQLEREAKKQEQAAGTIKMPGDKTA